jgi:hypothetical protein
MKMLWEQSRGGAYISGVRGGLAEEAALGLL